MVYFITLCFVIGLYILGEYRYKKLGLIDDVLQSVIVAVWICSIIVFAFMSVAVLSSHLTPERDLQKTLSKRESLVVRMERNSEYDVDIADDIRKFNDELIVGKRLHKNIYVGIFFGNYYDDVELIEYNFGE